MLVLAVETTREFRGDSAMYKALMSRPCASPPVGSYVWSTEVAL